MALVDKIMKGSGFGVPGIIEKNSNFKIQVVGSLRTQHMDLCEDYSG